MIIQNNQTMQYQSIYTRNEPQVMQVNSSVKSVQNDQSTISNEAQTLNAVEQRIANSYDVTNITEDERINLAKELHDNGLIGLDEFAVMSFPLNQVRDNMGINYSKNEAINLVEQYSQSLTVAKQNGASAKELQIRDNLLTAIKSLDNKR